MRAVVEGTIHSPNTPHHRVQYPFQVSTAARHIVLSASIVRSGDIIIISAQKPRETVHQTTQYKIYHKSIMCLTQGSSGGAVSDNCLLLD